MSVWKKVGFYNDKKVGLLIVDVEKEDLLLKDVSGAVFLIFTSCFCKLSLLNRIVENLIIKEPLSIVISGKNSSKVFDNLILSLSKKKNEKHVMTGLLEERDFIENLELFFTSSWPSEERFVEWKDYKILFLGKEIKEESVIKNIKEIIE